MQNDNRRNVTKILIKMILIKNKSSNKLKKIKVWLNKILNCV